MIQSTGEERPAGSARKLPLRKRLLFSTLAVLLFFGALELVLALAGVQPLLDERDPFEGFSGRVPVFELDAQRGVYRTPPRAVVHSFNYQEFAARKPDNGLRLFVIGGSSAYGFPWGAEAAFPAALGRALAASRPDRVVEAINAAAMSYGSHRLRILVGELLRYEPDLLVIYSGHNEFVERRFYRDLLERPRGLDPLREWLYHWRTYSAAVRWIGPRAAPPAAAPQTTGELLGLDVDRQVASDVDDAQRVEARDRFQENLRAILGQARAARVPVVLCTVPSNLRGWRPNQSAFDPALPRQQRVEAQTLLDEGTRALEDGRAGTAVELLERAATLAPRYAAVRFSLGQAYLAVRQPEAARRALREARDLDARPARAPGSFNGALRKLAREDGVLLVDVERAFEQRAVDGIPGFDLFEDYVHPKPRGHRLIAMEIWKTLLAAGFGGPAVEAREADFWQALGLTGEPDPATDAPLAAGGVRTAPLLYNLAVVLENQGLEDQAMQRYRQCLELDPGYYVARANLGRLLYRAARFAESAEQYRTALQADPRHVTSWIGLGEALTALARADEAIEALTRATTLDPDSAHAWHSLALALGGAQRYGDAEAAFRRAGSLDPDNAEVRANLGFALLMQGKLDRAERTFRDNLARHPDHLRTQNGLGAVLTESGRPDEAARWFRAVLDANPDDAMARAGLARLEERGAGGPADR